jgi:chromosome partitioning protein
VIPRTVRLSEAPSFGRTILEHDPQGIGAKAYRALAKEFLARHSAAAPATGEVTPAADRESQVE